MSSGVTFLRRHGAGGMSSSSMSMSGDDSGCTMSMLGNWDTVGTCVLTSSWKVSTEAQFAGTCIGVFLIVVLIEMIRRWGREWDRYIIRKEMAERAAYLASLDGAAANAGQNREAAIVASNDSGYTPGLDEKNGSAETSVEHLPSQQQQPREQQQPRNLSRLQRVFYGLPPGSAGATYWQARAPRFRPTMLQQMFRSLLYALQFAGAYIVMLIAMTFNGFIILSIILGGLFGHFVSTWDALAFDLSDADEDPYLLATGGGGSQQQRYITANGRRTLAAGQAAGSSYHASGACCG